MKPSLKPFFLVAFWFVQACSSFDVGDALFTGLCVWSEADCLKSCASDYGANGSGLAYDSCANMCQPGGYGGCD